MVDYNENEEYVDDEEDSIIMPPDDDVLAEVEIMDGPPKEKSKGKETAYQTLIRQKKKKNIADEINKDELMKIGDLCVQEYEVDVQSREKWFQTYNKAINLAKLLTERKETPWRNASNVKHPLLTQAAIQFNSRALPEIIPANNRIVKTRVIGPDKDGEKAARAKRISEHMSWQCAEQMEDWVEDTDRLTIVTPLVGTAFKKSYYSPTYRRNVSELVLAEDLVVGYWAKSLETAVRVTHRLFYRPNEIEEFIRADVFSKFDYATMPVESTDDTEDGINDDRDKPSRTSPQDADSPHLFLEMHRWLDLDGDNYKEPYIVTVHYETRKVVRIVARYKVEDIDYDESTDTILKIKAINYFTKYGFIPSIDGGFYDIGFGILMAHTTEAINTTMNQLLDAGHDQNAGGGFMSSSIQIEPGSGKTKRKFKFQPGTYYPVQTKGDDIRKSIMPRPTSQPSVVLFQLLEYVVNNAEKLMSSTEILSGQQSLANVPATTTMALIEQGLKVYGAIYKRLHRSLQKEFKKLFDLNAAFLSEEEYFNFQDEDYTISKEDYFKGDLNVIPASDPNNVNDAQKLLKAEALISLKGQGFNDEVINRRYLEALGIENINEIMEVEEQPPDPQTVIEERKIGVEEQKVELEYHKFQRDLIKDEVDVAKVLADIDLTKAKTMEALAKAEAEEAGIQIDQYKLQLEELSESRDRLTDTVKKQMAIIGNTAKGEQSGPDDAAKPTS